MSMELQVIYRDKHGRSIERHCYADPRARFISACVDVLQEVVANNVTHPLVKGFTVHYEEVDK